MRLIFRIMHGSTEQLTQQVRACGAAECRSVVLRCAAAMQEDPAQRSMGLACTNQVLVSALKMARCSSYLQVFANMCGPMSQAGVEGEQSLGHVYLL